MRKQVIRGIVIFLVSLMISPYCHKVLAEFGTTVTCSIADEDHSGFPDIVFSAFDAEGPRQGVVVNVFLNESSHPAYTGETDHLGKAVFLDPPIGAYDWESSTGESGEDIEIDEHEYDISDIEAFMIWLISANFMDSPNKVRSLFTNIAYFFDYELLENPLPIIDRTTTGNNEEIAAEWIRWSNGLVSAISEEASVGFTDESVTDAFRDIMWAGRSAFSSAYRVAAHGALIVKHVDLPGGMELRLTNHLQFRGGRLYRATGAALSLATIVLACLDILSVANPVEFQSIDEDGNIFEDATEWIQILSDGLWIIASLANINFLILKQGRSVFSHAAFVGFATAAAALSMVVTYTSLKEKLETRGFRGDWSDSEIWLDVLNLIGSALFVAAGVVMMIGWAGLASLATTQVVSSILAAIALALSAITLIISIIVMFWQYVETINSIREQMAPLMTKLWRVRSVLVGLDADKIEEDAESAATFSSIATHFMERIDAAEESHFLRSLREQLGSARYYWTRLSCAGEYLAEKIEETISLIDEFIATALHMDFYLGPVYFGTFEAHLAGIRSIEAECTMPSNTFSVNASYCDPDTYELLQISSFDGVTLATGGGDVWYSFLSSIEGGAPTGWAWDIPVESDSNGQQFAVSYDAGTESFLYDADGSGSQFGEYHEYTVPRTDEFGNLDLFHMFKFYVDTTFVGIHWLQVWTETLFDEEDGKLAKVKEAIEETSDALLFFKQASLYNRYRILFEDAHDTDNDELTGNYWKLRATLEEEGYTIEDIKVRPITFDLLATYGVVILPDLEIELSTDEIEAFAKYLSSGGRLLIIGEWKGAHIPSTVSAVSQVADIEFDNTIVYDPDDHVTYDYWVVIHEVDSSHPVGNGVNRFAMYAGSSLVLASENAHAIAWGDDNTYTLDPLIGPYEPDWNVTDPEGPEIGDPIVLAASEFSVKCGRTRLVAIGDSDLWKTDNSWIEDYDNKRLLINVINWLAEPTIPEEGEESEFGTIAEGETKTTSVEVEEGTGSLELTLEWAGSDLDLHVFDPQGHHVGFDYESGEVELQIPQSQYSGRDAKPEWVHILNPEPGMWTVEVFGVEVEGTELFRLEAAKQPPTDITPPTTSLDVGSPKYIDLLGNIYITSSTVLTLDAVDDSGETASGVALTCFKIYDSTYDSGWICGMPPISFQIEGLGDGTYSIDYNSTDNAGNAESTNTQRLILDNTAPIITNTNFESLALQDGVTLEVSAWDLSKVASVTFSIRCVQGDVVASGSATLSPEGKWEWDFDTTLHPDGYYIAVVTATDVLGNTGDTSVPFSIRNWACIELLPASKSNKGGRTMPVKFSLRMVEAVDPAQPFVYDEELTIVIYEDGDPDNPLQVSTLGDTARDYRISSEGEHYITNFKTLKKPTTYVVEIRRKDMLLGAFEFSTVK